MANDLTARGKELARRRARHGIRTIAEFARITGLDRQTITRAEHGQSLESTVLEIEHHLDLLDDEKGIDTHSDHSAQDEVEFDVTGPRTEWHITVRGPADRADEIRHQVVELLRDIEPGAQES